MFVDRLTVVVFNHMNVFSYSMYVFVKTTRSLKITLRTNLIYEGAGSKH